ncbi:hypothetical protein TSAR_004269 [Trichomalopsis sarcophagae]|uniref:Uncharacterized protein n=1 Tax=Trichomalopsis sarcophagae TaxID=543379 RepID=A0A232FEL9_9HYME|nr:hypothetical protein TSAR_004269 [Trichomalopsis sarcophagae]
MQLVTAFGRLALLMCNIADADKGTLATALLLQARVGWQNLRDKLVNPEAISQLSIDDLDENMLDDESDVTNTPDEIIACKRKIGVQGDGTWQRRGHRSYNEVFTILGQKSGKMFKNALERSSKT